MKIQTLATLFTLTAVAHAGGRDTAGRVAHKRQAASSSAATTTSVASASGSTPAVSSGSASAPAASSGSASAPVATGGYASVSVSGANAFSIPPLSDIIPVMSTQILSASTTYSPGSTPTGLSNAPPLPSAFAFSPTAWPALDKLPPTDSNEVKEWLKELEGWDIPNLEPTTSGECAADPQFAADAEKRGWWTCGGWTRDTDITECPDKNTWGVSFDDGPGPKTPVLLDYLTSKNLTSTFFVVGSRVVSRPEILIEEYMAGHEISVHTWAHPSLTTLTNEEIVAELGWTRKAIKTVLGVTPTTMRPPYGDIDDRVRAIAMAMGLVPIMWTRTPEGVSFDTFDWKIGGAEVTAAQSYEQFGYILGNATKAEAGFIVLQHDLYVQSTDMAIGYTLDMALNYKNPTLTLKSIGSCIGKPIADMYRETNTNTSFPFSNSTDASVKGDGTSDSNSSKLGENGDGALASAPFAGVMALIGAATLFTML